MTITNIQYKYAITYRRFYDYFLEVMQLYMYTNSDNNYIHVCDRDKALFLHCHIHIPNNKKIRIMLD